MKPERLRLAVAAGLAVAALAVGVALAKHGAGDEGAMRLPDLDQETPTGLDILLDTSEGGVAIDSASARASATSGPGR